MFNISISLGELPDEWKVSRFTPIPKHGHRTNPSNYRLISLLSIVSELLEKNMAQLLTERMAVNRYLLINGGSVKENQLLVL